MRRNRVWAMSAIWLAVAPLAGCSGLVRRDAVAPVQTASKSAPAQDEGAEIVRVSLAMAATLENAGDTEEAIKLYEDAVRNSPAAAEARRRLAQVYAGLGEFEKAREKLEKALEEAPKDVQLLNELGYSFFAQQKWPEAEKQFRLAVTHDPKNRTAWLSLGLTLGQQGKYDASLEAFDKVLRPAEAKCRLAAVYAAQGKKDDARRAYNEALKLDAKLQTARDGLRRLDTEVTVRQVSFPATEKLSRPTLPPQPFIEPDAEADTPPSPPGVPTSSAPAYRLGPNVTVARTDSALIRLTLPSPVSLESAGR